MVSETHTCKHECETNSIGVTHSSACLHECETNSIACLAFTPFVETNSMSVTHGYMTRIALLVFPSLQVNTFAVFASLLSAGVRCYLVLPREGGGAPLNIAPLFFDGRPSTLSR